MLKNVWRLYLKLRWLIFKAFSCFCLFFLLHFFFYALPTVNEPIYSSPELRHFWMYKVFPILAPLEISVAIVVVYLLPRYLKSRKVSADNN